jgi:sulfate/thiosulfate transport system permease protein
MNPNAAGPNGAGSTGAIVADRPPTPRTQDAPPPGQSKQPPRWVRYGLIGAVTIYLGLLLLIPAINVFYQAFQGGLGPFLHAFQSSELRHAIGLTLLIALITVPLNTAFGLCAAWAITRQPIPGRPFLMSLLDLPFSISPVVVGVMMIMLYGKSGWFGPALSGAGLRIIFALPGMVLASLFVTLPFVVREVLPALEDAGQDQEEAARTLGASEWQVFWRVTVPSIRWGLLYGVILTNARAMGEFGAVTVVSGSIIGKTQTLPLFIEESYKNYDGQDAYTGAVLLACLGIVTIVAKALLEQRHPSH